MWVGTEDGLNLFDRGRGTFTVYRNDLPTAPLIGRDQITAIYQDASGAMWIGTYGGGLCLFDPERGKFVRNYRHRDGDHASLSSDKIYCLLEDRRGRFWIGTNSGGLNLFDRANGTFSQFHHRRRLAQQFHFGDAGGQAGQPVAEHQPRSLPF